MPFDSEPFNSLQFKASHNSYDRDEDLHEQLQFDPLQPAEGACRGLELDIVRHSDGSGGRAIGYFQVSHSRGGNGPPLASYLGYLLSFHANAAQHDPVIVILDIKSESGSVDLFPGEIDSYLKEWFDERLIFRPFDLARNRLTDLVRTVAASGWPSLGKLRGKFLFCLSGTESWKAHYAETLSPSSLCFSDIDVDDDDDSALPPAKGNRLFANLNLFSDDHSTWKQTIPRLRKGNMIVRGYVLNGAKLWQKSIDAGVNILATDEVRGKSRASVGPGPYRTG